MFLSSSNVGERQCSSLTVEVELHTMQKRSPKRFDLIVWGATGYSGRLIVEHLAKQTLSSPKWAIAGRDRQKLDELKSSLSLRSDVEVLAVDLQSIDEVVQQTRVIIAAVGPFAKYGTPVIDSCVRHGVHYADITGETGWVREMIKTYHKQAEAQGVFIVPFCGCDSIPSDLGVFLAADEMTSRYGKKCSKVRGLLQLRNLGASGGTAATAIEAVSKRKGSGLGNSYVLIPEKTEKGPSAAQILPGFNKDVQKWTGPWFMASVNGACVQRSNFLLGYGTKLDYRESQMVPSWFTAFKFAPKSGDGPPRDKLEKGLYNVTVVAHSETQSNEEPKKVIAHANAGCDGYLLTGRCAAESGLALAFREEDLRKRGIKGGVLTPAACFGPVLKDIWTRAGFTYSIEDRK